MANKRKYTDQQYDEAASLIDQGASFREAGESVGIPHGTLYARLRGRKDPTPGGGQAKRTAATKAGPNDAQLAGLFTKVAVAPAIPMGLWAHCDFCAGHFVNTGPDAAAKLVELSHDHPALRRLMEGLWKYADEVAWAGILGMWLGVPVAHHLAPDFVYRWVQLPLGLPPRGDVTYAPPVTNNGHAHQDTAPVTPFGGMDLESLMRMAQGMGIEVDMNAAMQAMADNDAAIETADTAEPSDPGGTSESNAADTVTPETAAPDQDASE